MMKIDAHQHFWNYNPHRDTWIDASMQAIQKDFMPPDLLPHLQQHDFDGCVAVQAAQSHSETQFLLNLAREYPWVKKVVGWIDLRSATLEQSLDEWKGYRQLAGFRQILQDLDPAVMYEPDFRAGIQHIGDRGFTYDLLIYPQHLDAAIDLVRNYPDQRFVIDHLAKPDIRSGNSKTWQTGIKKIAELDNVYCKFSGMVTEADWNNWTIEDLEPYLDTILNCFGPERLMYGSDWPVALLAASYDDVVDVAMHFIEPLSRTEQHRLMGATACEFYGILD